MYNKETIRGNIIRSQYNLHTIKNNLCFHKDKVDNIHEVNLEQENTLLIMKNLIEKNNINYTYQHSLNDYSILGLNFLENCGNIIKFNPTIRNKKNNDKLKDIIKLYHSLVLGDYLYTMIYNQNSWDNIENIITFNVYTPLHYYIKNCDKIKENKLTYNKYLSHSIIYTHNSKLLTQNKYNIHVIFKVYDLFYDLFYGLNIFKDKESIRKEISNLLNYYEIDVKILNKFIKYYEFLFSNKKIDKKLFKLFSC